MQFIYYIDGILNINALSKYDFYNIKQEAVFLQETAKRYTVNSLLSTLLN